MNALRTADMYRNRMTLAVYWGIRCLLVTAAAIYLWRGDWAASGSTVLILLILLVPPALRKRKFYLPFALDLGTAVFVFLTLFLGEIARFYDRIPFWDKFLHFQSGLLLGATGYVLVYTLNEHDKTRLNLSPGFISLFAVTFSLSLGVLWEIGEFVADGILGSHWQLDNTDTMGDIIADLTGALITCVTGYFWMYRYKRLPLTPWLLRFFESVPRAKKKEEASVDQ